MNQRSCTCLTLTPKSGPLFCNLAVPHQEVDMPFRYSIEFQLRTCERMLAGEAIKDLVVELGISEATLPERWKRQALIDAGAAAGFVE